MLFGLRNIIYWVTETCTYNNFFDYFSFLLIFQGNAHVISVIIYCIFFIDLDELLTELNTNILLHFDFKNIIIQFSWLCIVLVPHQCPLFDSYKVGDSTSTSVIVYIRPAPAL